MKGKMLIVLAGLVLVFGMLIASCDNALYPVDPNKGVTNPTKIPVDLNYFEMTVDGGTESVQAILKAGVKYLNSWEDGTTKPVDKLSYKNPSNSPEDFVNWLSSPVGDKLRKVGDIYCEVFTTTP